MAYRNSGSNEVAWPEKTYREIRNIGDQEGSFLGIPMGSVEQHGHHMPVGTDATLVEAVANLGAQRASDDGVPVLVTPVEWIGSSPHHMSLGGTITGDYRRLLDLLGGYRCHNSRQRVRRRPHRERPRRQQGTGR